MSKTGIAEEIADLMVKLIHSREHGVEARSSLYWRLFGIIEGISFVEFVKDGIWTGLVNYTQTSKLEELLRRADGEGEPLEKNYYAIRNIIREILN